MSIIPALMRGVPVNLFELADSGTGNSDIVALLPRAQIVTWQTIFGTAPASITVQIKTSNDGVNFNTSDSSTAVGGEIRSFQTAARFVLARINAISGGDDITVSIVAKPVG